MSTSPALLSRRSLLRGAASVTVLAALAAVSSCADGSPRAAEGADRDDGSALLRLGHTITDEASTTGSTTGTSPADHPDAITSDAAAIGSIASQDDAVRADFRAGRTIGAAGWLLSTTEADVLVAYGRVPAAHMLIDASTVTDGSTIGADLCIIGGGPAGLTIATDLAGAGLDVVVLESGREAWDQRTQDLAQGPVTAEPFRFNGVDLTLSNTRMRQLGGSSNHWTGQCRPLDAHDFDARAATAGVGWPFGLDELAPWYDQAVETVELLSPEWSPEWWSETTGAPLLPTDERLRSVVFQFSPPTRFGERFAPALRAAENIRCYLGATVTGLTSDSGGASVRTADVATFDGSHFHVAAARYVVATGGVDVPRLLLASTNASPAGLGNGNDLVGRFFMEHPHAIGGRALLTVPVDELSAYLIGPRSGPDIATGLTWTGLSPIAAVQDEAGITNGCVLLWSVGAGPPRGDRDAETWSVEAVRSILAGPDGTGPVTELTLSLRIEQAPNPDSRVVLAPDRDELGMPRAEVQWRLTDADHRTLRQTVEIVAESIGAAGMGRIEVDPGGRPIDEWPIEIGNHHMGTTRMSADPALGVVDPDGRMHEVDNLFVCGSSVFPTSGMANPTLTIVALAHRLAAHLLGSSGAVAPTAPIGGGA